MPLFAGVMILVIVFFVVMYVLRSARRNAVLVKKRLKSQNYFLHEMDDFTLDSFIVFNQEEDLFSPGRMRNAWVEIIGEEIQLMDYIKNVPWFFYL